jgi:hypothetical protein
MSKKKVREHGRQLRKLLEEAIAHHKLCEAARKGLMTQQEENRFAEEIEEWRRGHTKRQEEILWESLAKYYPDLCEAIPGKETAAEISQWRRDYEKAYYGRCRKSERKRKAFDFLRAFRNAAIWEQESCCPTEDSDRLLLLTPLLDALPTCENPNRFDSEFIKGLAEAMQILDSRIKSYAKAQIGSGDLHLDKWLLEYELTLPGGQAKHTVRELNQQFVSKFRSISDDKLRQRCKLLGVPLKSDAQGKASEKWKAKQKKKLNSLHPS